jgi:hypothetical protein
MIKLLEINEWKVAIIISLTAYHTTFHAQCKHTLFRGQTNKWMVL